LLAAADELATDSAGAEELIKRHQELATEIDTRSDAIAAVRAFGKRLIESAIYPEVFPPSWRHTIFLCIDDVGQEVQGKLDTLTAELAALGARMKARREQLEQCRSLQAFNHLAELAEAWITARAAAIASEEVGSSLEGVATWQKKHTDFEKSLAAQREKINEVAGEATRLGGGGHYAAADVAARSAVVAARWTQLEQLSDARKVRLDEAQQLQQFLRDADEAETWMAEKIQTASDPSYKDASNLQGKLQQHQAFQAEVAANEERVKKVVAFGEEQLAGAHGAADAPVVTPRLETLRSQWARLQELSADKLVKLQAAREQQQYNHGVEDIEFWLGDVELLLASKDLGKDLAGVQNLLKKHGSLLADIEAHRARVEAIAAQAALFAREGHFDAAAITARQDVIAARYTQAQATAAARGTQLAAALALQQCLRDLGDEESWVREKEHTAASGDYGKDLTGVQSLQKKHQTFEGELAGHAAHVAEVVAAARRLASGGHYAAATLTEQADVLDRSWTALQKLARQRHGKLAQALSFQEFSADLAEEESWVAEKSRVLASEEQPDTLSGAQGLLKKHAAFEAALGEHTERGAALAAAGTALAAGGAHFQAAAIAAGCVALQAHLGELAAAAAARATALQASLRCLRFAREADSIEAWIADKEPLARSDETGRDLPSTRSLLGKHDALEAALAAFQERLALFAQPKGETGEAAVADEAATGQRRAAVLARWDALKAAAAGRGVRLLAEQKRLQEIEDLLLAFAKKASQFNSWFENAEEDLTDPVRVNSLDEIAASQAQHDAFLATLAGAKADFEMLRSLDATIKAHLVAKNPYTWFTIETLDLSWTNLTGVIKDRGEDLAAEHRRQEDNEQLRLQFAGHANEFHVWLVQVRAALVDGSGKLEDQFTAIQARNAEIVAEKAALKKIEDLGVKMEEAFILDNKHTEHSTVGLAQQWDQLEQLGMRMQHNLEQQIKVGFFKKNIFMGVGLVGFLQVAGVFSCYMWR
jgi:spectrin alpha